MSRRRAATLAIVGAVLVVAAACGSTPTTQLADPTGEVDPTLLDETPTDSPIVETEAPGETRADPAVLDDLTVAPEAKRTGYKRSSFKHWSDLDEDGCNTRNEVLLEESLLAITVGPRCRLIGGSWFSPYDGKTTTKPSTFDVDHYVPLAEAWDSGAKAWSPEEREAYANDVDHADALIAVTASSNRSKSDQDPAEWMPPREEFRCTYAATWVGIKLAWSLTVDEDEMAALRDVLDDC